MGRRAVRSGVIVGMLTAVSLLSAHAAPPNAVPVDTDALTAARHATHPTIPWRSFGRFWDHWKLVTTRYRADINEMRFIYANPIAWSTLGSGKYPFRRGAMLAKVAAPAQQDSMFPNSIVPMSQGIRIQIMRKDYGPQSVHGWTYQIFPVSDTGAMPKHTTQSCAACHEIAKPRDFVFAQPVSLFARQTYADNPEALKGFKAMFAASTAAVPPGVAHVIANMASHIGITIHPTRGLVMPLFEGAMSEVSPAIGLYAIEDMRSYVVYDPATNSTVVSVNEPRRGCAFVGSATPTPVQANAPRGAAPHYRYTIVEICRDAHGIPHQSLVQKTYIGT